jgi:nucleoside-diphosphate-sugar epimerase
MKALVTGDRGFLGRRFAEELERRGYDVVGLDTKRSPAQDCRLWFSSSAGTRAGHFDLVVHAAAVIGGRARIDGAPLATAVNLSIDAEMFRWASAARPGRVVYFSSSAAYPVAYQVGNERNLLIEEHLDLPRLAYEPDQVYGWTKVVGEVLAGKLREAGVPVTVVRPFSGYGADQDEDYPFPSFIRRACERGAADGGVFRIWGNGNQVRDFVHVDDIVARTLRLADDGTAEPVNLCTGRPTSFNELARLVCSEAGWDDPKYAHLLNAPTGVRYRVGSPARMRRLTGDLPMISLETGIRRALDASSWNRHS